MRLHYYDGCVVWYVYSDVWLVCMDTSGSVLATGPYPLSHVYVHVMSGGREWGREGLADSSKMGGFLM